MTANGLFIDPENNKVEGLFKELIGVEYQLAPSLLLQAHKLNADTAAVVAEYLDQGIGLVDYMGAVKDPLNANKFIPGGESLYTDGDWLWRLDLSYFVKTYKVAVSNEFINNIMKSGGKMPSDIFLETNYEIYRTRYWNALQQLKGK